MSDQHTGRMPRAAVTALRVLGAVGGGYALTALTVLVGALALSRAGMARSEAEAVALAAMLGFVLYLVLLLWGFSVRHVGRLWLGFGGGAALMWALWRSLA